MNRRFSKQEGFPGEPTKNPDQQRPGVRTLATSHYLREAVARCGYSRLRQLQRRQGRSILHARSYPNEKPRPGAGVSCFLPERGCFREPRHLGHDLERPFVFHRLKGAVPSGCLGWTRTTDLLVNSESLLPTELQGMERTDGGARQS